MIHLKPFEKPMKEALNSTEPVAGAYLAVTRDRVYVGSTGNSYDRIQKHKSLLKHGKHWNKELQEGFDQTGKLDVVVFPMPNSQAALQLEQKLLDKGKEMGAVLNIAEDVTRSQQGRPVTEEVKEKLRYTRTDEQKKRMKEGRLKNSRKISVEGTLYDNIQEVAAVYNLSYFAVWERLKSSSKSFSSWVWIE